MFWINRRFPVEEIEFIKLLGFFLVIRHFLLQQFNDRQIIKDEVQNLVRERTSPDGEGQNMLRALAVNDTPWMVGYLVGRHV
jgi:hypothetical protein